MAAASQSARSLLEYYGPKASLDGLKLSMPVTPEELEFFAEQELVNIVPNFALEGSSSKLFCIAATYGPFQPNMPVAVPLWLALMLLRRKKCRIQAPEWMSKQNLQDAYQAEKQQSGFYQLPFYYVEISQILFRIDNNPVETFGNDDDFAAVRGLVEDIRKVRYNKIESGLRQVSGAITVKLNNLGAAECNVIRLLFKGTLDTFFEINKNNQLWEQQSFASAASLRQ